MTNVGLWNFRNIENRAFSLEINPLLSNEFTDSEFAKHRRRVLSETIVTFSFVADRASADRSIASNLLHCLGERILSERIA